MQRNVLHTEVSIGGVSLAERALFAKHLAIMLKSGLTVTEALEIAQDASSGKLKRTIGHVRLSVESGRTLSQALAEHTRIFSPLFVQATYAGEVSGTLVENLENIALELEKEKELVAKVKGALIYPVVVLVASFFLAMGLTFFILPKIVPLFEGLKVDLPVTTRALIIFAHAVENNGIMLFGGTFGGALALSILLRQRFMQPITHMALLHMPILKPIVRGANLTRFSRTLGMLIKSGVTIDEALEITKNSMGNYYYRQSLSAVSHHI